VKKKTAFLWAASIDLLLDAILGTVWFVLVFVLYMAGVGLVPAFGIGLLLMGAAGALTRLTGGAERARAAALYQIEIPAPIRKRAAGQGGWRPLRQALLNAVDPVTWRTILHHFTSMVFGWIVVAVAVAGLSLGAGLLLTPVLPDAVSSMFAGIDPVRWIDQSAWGAAAGILVPVLGAAIVAATLAAVYFGGLLDRSLSAALLGPSRNVQLEERIDTLADARQGAVDAAALERLRIERDLHDGAQPRLVSAAMTLGMARRKFDDDPVAAREMLDRAHAETKAAITELRQLARGIHPAVLTDRGLDPALSALAAGCIVPTALSVDVPNRLSPEIEAVIYFTVAEALTNVAKHSGASTCEVAVVQDHSRVTATVRDNGTGGAAVVGKGGLAGMRDRVRAANGTLAVDSPPGGPSLITVEVPCAS
jgi:signal transduction histidine kinase